MWKIKQVSEMTGVSRKDIQRICDPNDVAYIFTPTISKPGSRYFDVNDIFKILLVGKFKEMGYNLTQTKNAVKELGQDDSDYASILDKQIVALEEQQRRTEENLKFSYELKNALGDDGPNGIASRMLLAHFIEAFFDAMYSVFDDLDAPIVEDDFNNPDVDPNFKKLFSSSSMELANIAASKNCLGQWGVDTTRFDADFDTIYATIKNIDHELQPDDLSEFVSLCIDQMSCFAEDEDKDMAKRIVWLILMRVIDMPKSRLFIELSFGANSAITFRASLEKYAFDIKWISDEDEIEALFAEEGDQD